MARVLHSEHDSYTIRRNHFEYPFPRLGSNATRLHLVGIALSLVVSYFLFRTIVKKYLVRKTPDEATRTNPTDR